MNNRILKKLSSIIIIFSLVIGVNLSTAFANKIATSKVIHIKETAKFDISKGNLTVKSVNNKGYNSVLVKYDNNESYIVNSDQEIEIFQSNPDNATNNIIFIDEVGTRENPLKFNLSNINIKTDNENIPLHVANNSHVRFYLCDDSVNKLNVTSRNIPAFMIDADSSATIESDINNSSIIKISGILESICNFGKLNLNCRAEINSDKSNSSAGICNDSGELYVENAILNISSNIYGIYNYYGDVSLADNSYINIHAYNGIFNDKSSLNFCNSTLDILKSGIGIYNSDNSIFNLYSGEINVYSNGSAIENYRSIFNINGGILNCNSYGSDINSSGMNLRQHSKLNISDGNVYCRGSYNGISAKASSQINMEGGFLHSEGSVLGYGLTLSKDSSFTKKNGCETYISCCSSKID